MHEGALRQARVRPEGATAAARVDVTKAVAQVADPVREASTARAAPRPPPPPRPPASQTKPVLAATAPDAPSALAPTRAPVRAISFPTMTEIASVVDASDVGVRRGAAWRGVIAAAVALIAACVMLAVILSNGASSPAGQNDAALVSASASPSIDAGSDARAPLAKIDPPTPSETAVRAAVDAGSPQGSSAAPSGPPLVPKPTSSPTKPKKPSWGF